MLSRHRKTPAEPVQTSLGAGRRTLVLLGLVAIAGVPAGVLRAFCAGHSCDEPANASSEVPFCSLPGGVRDRVAAGFREGRSPDLLAVTSRTPVAAKRWPAAPWPSIQDDGATRVPLAFWGDGVDPNATIPPGTGLDDVAPTIAAIMGFERPHPDVRSGTPIEGVPSGAAPRLVVEIVWVGHGARDLESIPGDYLPTLTSSGASTYQADTTSLPVDPAAVLTTIGTGGRPSQHGITGALVRDDVGRLRKAWSPKSPVSVIATLGDDLDEELGQKPVIGMAGGRGAYRGAMGGNWYIDVDRDRFLKTKPGAEHRAARELLRRGFGTDDVPDLAVIAVEDDDPERAVRAAVRAAEKASDGSVAFALTATGSTGVEDALDPDVVVEPVEELVEAAAAGGLFLDQDELARQKVSEDEVLRSIAGVESPSGGALFADVFPAIAVAFGRYC